MKNKPIYFYILSIILISIAFSFPIQLVYEYDYSITDYLLACRHLTFFNYAVILLCLFTAFDSITVNKRLKFSSVALILTTALNNSIVGYMAINYTFLQTVIATGLFILPFTYLLKSDIRSLLNDPGLHWWKTPTRFQRDWIIKIDGLNSTAKSLNISRTGILLKIEPSTWSKSDLKNLKSKCVANSSLPITIRMGNKNFSNQATIIRQQMNSKELYVALKFNPMNLFDSLLFENHIQRTAG